MEKILDEKHSNKISKKKNSEPSVNSERSEQVKEKIREMEVWMRQKRYSESTINTYLSFIKQFFAVNSDLNWDGISIEVITNYN